MQEINVTAKKAVTLRGALYLAIKNTVIAQRTPGTENGTLLMACLKTFEYFAVKKIGETHFPVFEIHKKITRL